MNVQYHKWYSQCLNREMEYKTYGDWGRPFIVVPTQDGRFFDWENRGMIDIMRPHIDSGEIRVICIDAIDAETWSAKGQDGGHRSWLQEQWFHYVTDELLPNVQQSDNEMFYVTGCSLGATHAVNFMMRRPDRFQGCIALSGLYHADYFFDGYRDENVYNNSPADYMANMPWDHYYLNMYPWRQIIICVGQGRWEDECSESTRKLQQIFHDKGIPAWFDYWGYDCDHDWPEWYMQLPYFLDYLLSGQQIPNTCYW